MKKQKIEFVAINYHAKVRRQDAVDLWVHRGNNQSGVRVYPIRNMTQYQRAVRLLNAFVERNMK